MPFVKVVKDRAYFKRYQVKFKRRRKGKTDYKARKNLIKQDKYKYNVPKFRFVVRITNKDIICQVVAAKIIGDVVLTAAYAHELPRYGLKVGLTNYAAAYAVGLLTARRLLKKIGLDNKFKGKKNPNGKFFLVRRPTYKQKKRLQKKGKKVRDDRPFVALLDIGLRRTTTGAKIFAALKGACDGGLSIPHNPKRFAGFDSKKRKLDPAKLRKRIFGGHVADWMRKLKEDDEQKFNKQFSRYISAGIGPDDLEALYASVHKKIREDPAPKSTRKPAPEKQKRWNPKKRTRAQRKDRIRQKIESYQRKMAAKMQQGDDN